MNRIKKKKKELIQHNVTYKKLKIFKKERERMWLIVITNLYIYIYIYIKCHKCKIIKLMEIYTVFWDRQRLSNYWRYILFLGIDLY